LALAVGTVGGGAAGTFAASQWRTTPTVATTTAASPITIQNSTQAAPGNIAGAVFGSAGRSIVSVISSGQVRNGLTPEGSGTGFVVSTEGLILTNYHVVGSADSVSVRFSDGTTSPAEVLGSDQGNDIALLRAAIPAGVPALPLGDSDGVAVGETAIAIGSPFGLDQTVTQGIVSAVNRTWSGGGRALRALIQTDAPINPGNSGGPLLNANGEVIGITTLIESPVRGNVGIGFAVPINTAQRVLPQLQAGAELEPVWLGISTQGDEDTAQPGIVVAQVVANSPAQEGGVQVGDIITAVDGTAVNDLEQLGEQLATQEPGDTVSVTVERNGVQQQIDVTLEAWPSAIE
jgi:S1-C subfamily serine protease